MATYPFLVSGAGPTIAKNVFKVKFSESLSSLPNIRAYDNNQTFPNTGNLTTVAFGIFTGNYSNDSKPMLHFLDTSRQASSATNWYTTSTIKAGAATCMMKGNISYLTPRYSAASMVANASLTWNALIKTPYGCYPTIGRLHDVVVRFTFVGNTPSVTFYANNKHAGGTDASPAWGTITPDTNGVRFGSSTATNSSIIANIPLVASASFEVTTTAWIATS